MVSQENKFEKDMITKITHTKLFFPAVSAMLFISTCFFCSCYTTDIIKPFPEKIAEESPENLETIKFKNGDTFATASMKCEIDFDSLFQKSAITVHYTDTNWIDKDKFKVFHKKYPISLDSIKSLRFQKVNLPLSILAGVGLILGILTIVAFIELASGNARFKMGSN